MSSEAKTARPMRLMLSVLALSTGVSAWAGEWLDVSIKGTVVRLVAPEGMCFFDEEMAWDRRDLTLQRRLGRGTNLTLAGMADCDELERIRTGRILRLAQFGYFKSSLPLAGNKPLGMSRQALVAGMTRSLREEGMALFEGSEERLEAKAAELRTDLRPHGVTSLGIVFAEPDMVAFAGLARIEQRENFFERCSVTAMTALGEIPLSLNLYSDYRDESTIWALSAQARTTLQAVLESNP